MVLGGDCGCLTVALLFFVLLWIVQCVVSLELNASCVTPSGGSGKCILFEKCKRLLERFEPGPFSSSEAIFIKASWCGLFEDRAVLCCPDDRTYYIPKPPQCGTQLSDHLLLLADQTTQIREFPWTALILYKKPKYTFDYHCGGSLINDRYVVTAAHCIVSLPHRWKVYRVRLGEWDLNATKDCQDDFCSETPIDYSIQTIVVHSLYNTSDQNHANDIALIRLVEQVQYSATIRPICLPLSKSLQENNNYERLSYAVGWGKTQNHFDNDMKQMVELRVVDMKDCAPIYERNVVFLNSTQMCAEAVRVADFCSVDAGGPLMRWMAGSWYLIGVASFGTKKCGTAGVPGVYTNVAEYVDWIIDNINNYDESS